MATHAQLLQSLTAASHTYGWGAVAAFDGAIIAPALASYYGPLLHDLQSLKPISADRIPFTDDLDLWGTLADVVLAAPQISFSAASLQDSRVKVSFELLQGTYSERRRGVGEPETLDLLVNLAAGRRCTFTMDVNLAPVTAEIDRNGNVRLTLGPGSNPSSDLGSLALAQEKVGEYLLGILNAGHSRALVLPLGTLLSQRGHILPKGFVLRTQAKPGASNGEGALIAFIRGPDGAMGTYPTDQGLPYLIPEDLHANGKATSATLLVSRSYPPLREGEAARLLGQVLFPNEQYFKSQSSHDNTRDITEFGRVEVPTPAQTRPAERRNAPGVTAQLVTRSIAANPRTVNLSASTSTIDGWAWTLQVAGLGTLQAEGANAVYTPPTALPAGTNVLVQRIIAHNSRSGEHREACCILRSGLNTAEFDTLLVENVAPGGTAFLTHNFEPEPGDTEQWTVLGRGEVANGFYTAPMGAGDDLEVVVYRCTYDRGGTPALAGYGYCIIQLHAVAPDDHWSTLGTFTLKPAYASTPLYANGLQQLAVEIKIDTGAGEPPVTDEEWASLRLVFEDGVEVDRIASTLEGLLPNGQSGNSQWGSKRERNTFTQAGATYGADFKAAADDSVFAIRTKILYLHTTADMPRSFAARFTDTYGADHTSNIPGGSEADFRVLRVTPRAVPHWTNEQYAMAMKRVRGGYLSDTPGDPIYTPENPNFDWNLDTTDYWHFLHKVDGVQVLLVRLQWDEDGPGVKWESQQNAEDMFSYLGYALILRGKPIPQYLEFADALYNPVLHNTNPPFSGRPPHAAILDNEAGDAGSLLMALIRVANIYYRQKAKIPGFNLERDFAVTLWDEHGNRHRLSLGFAGVDRNTLVWKIL